MKRRELITLLGGAAAWPLAASAQQPTRHIGMLIGDAENDPEIQARLAASRQALEGNGWKEGGNLRIDYRFAPASPDQAQVYAKELVALRPDVLVGNSTPATAALLVIFPGACLLRVQNPNPSSTLARHRYALAGYNRDLCDSCHILNAMASLLSPSSARLCAPRQLLKEAIMRTVSIILTIFATLSLSIVGAHAGSWCAHYRNGATNCGFHSFAQCQAAVSGIGGYCSQG